MTQAGTRWRSDLALALLTGGAQALALSPYCAALGAACPAILQSLGAAGLLWALWLRRQTPARAGRYAWWHASTWLLGATGWMYVSLHTYGGLPAWLAAGAVVLLCLALSGYMGLAGWAWARLATGRPGVDAVTWLALWLAAELARAQIFTGFPWGASGYALIDTPWRALAPWLGVYGLGAVWAGVLAWGVWWTLSALPGGRVRRGAMALAAWGSVMAGLVWWGGGRFTVPHGAPLGVSLIQGNIPQDEKFSPERMGAALMWHAEQVVHAPGPLVVAPETAITLLPEQLPEGFWSELTSAFAARPGRLALVGMPLGDALRGYENAVVALDDHVDQAPGEPYHYTKHHLVPFGEFIPHGFHWFVQLMNMPLGDFSRGPLAAPSLPWQGQRIAPNICYEDLYGEELATRFTRADAAPTVLVNVSNLAWFGEHVAMHQHLQIARMRSVEFQIPTVRATNTGATVVIDGAGQVTHRLPFNVRAVLQAQVQGRRGVTPYVAWAGRFGLWPLWATAALLVAWAARRRAGFARSTRPIH